MDYFGHHRYKYKLSEIKLKTLKSRQFYALRMYLLWTNSTLWSEILRKEHEQCDLRDLNIRYQFMYL